MKMFLKTILLGFCLATGALYTSASAEQIMGGTPSFDSIGQSGNPFEGGFWGNAAGGRSWAQYLLAKPTEVKSIYIKSAGTDITSSGSLIEVKVLVSGKWNTIYTLENKVINRDFSGGKTGPQIGPLRIKLGGAVIGGVRIDMAGHGWFGAEDIRLEGP